METGLELLQFPTLIWLGIEYSVYTVMQASRRSWRIGQEEDVQVYFFGYGQTLQHDATHLIAAKMAASARVNGDQIANDSLAELDELTNSDMVSALASIVAGGNRATQSLSDAFASANKEFGMADQMIGGYQVTGRRKEEEQQQQEEALSTDSYKIVSIPKASTYNQLTLLSMEHVKKKSNNGHHNGNGNSHHNGHHKNRLPDPNSCTMPKIAVPQLEMPILKRASKRRKKARRGTFLFPM